MTGPAPRNLAGGRHIGLVNPVWSYLGYPAREQGDTLRCRGIVYSRFVPNYPLLAVSLFHQPAKVP